MVFGGVGDAGVCGEVDATLSVGFGLMVKVMVRDAMTVTGWRSCAGSDADGLGDERDLEVAVVEVIWVMVMVVVVWC